MVKTGEWLSEGWDLVKQDLFAHVLLALVVGLGSAITGGILGGPLICGYIWIIIEKMRNPAYKPAIGDLGKGFEVFVHALVACLIWSLFASVASSACGLGQFVVNGFLVFTYPLIMDRRMEFWPAIQASYEKVTPDWLGFCLFHLAQVGVMLLGVIACVVGVFVTGPICVVAMVAAYRDNFGLEGAAAAPPTEPMAPPAAPTPPPTPTQ